MTIDEQLILTEKLNYSSALYYQGKETLYTDTGFDLLLKDLQKAEKENNFVAPNSPTLRVGSDLRDGFAKVAHPKGFPMLTIENCYNDEDLIRWFNKMYKEYNVSVFNVSMKYDGVSCELHYKDGILVEASTRGDKIIGDDITDNVRTIKSVPLNLLNSPSDELYVRGEVLLPKTRLIALNEEREALGEPKFANCRNACSGSIKQLDSHITASRGLIFRAWDIFSPDKNNHTSQTQKMDVLHTLGFVVDHGTESFSITLGHDKIMNMAMLRKVADFWEIAKKQDYDCDGIVIKVDDTHTQNKIGTKDNRAIEWGIARKWNEEKIVSTILKDIAFQCGRTGNITPVGILEPVECDGVVITNVMLNNESFIKSFDLHILDEIVITRSGGVIPVVVGNNSNGKHNDLTEIKFPSVCPSCGHELIKDGEYWKCVNPNCQAQIERRIEQWCRKDCMDIPQVGPALIHRLVELDIVKHPLDLYSIPIDFDDAEHLAHVLGEGYGVKSMSTFIYNILESRNRPFEKVLYGLGIEGIGKETAKVLANHFKTYEAFLTPSYFELREIDGVGHVTAHNILVYLEEFGESIYHQLKAYGLSTEIVKEITETNDQPLKGLTIVFTGKSSRWTGDKTEEELTKLGAKCSHSVSSKLDYLVTGDKPGGSKVKKAQDLGVKIVTESEFFSIFAL